MIPVVDVELHKRHLGGAQPGICPQEGDVGRAIAEDGLDGERQLVRPSAAVLVVERAEFSILWRPEARA